MSKKERDQEKKEVSIDNIIKKTLNDEYNRTKLDKYSKGLIWNRIKESIKGGGNEQR